MRISSVHLPAFGRLSDFSRELSPGLNVFFGHNEAGKSTLQQGICALLYGFYDGDRARQDETARHQRFRPWNLGHYRGSLQYTLDDGREFEVRRDFSSPDVATQLIDSVLGIDVSPQFGRARHGNVPFARKHLGMSRAVFRSCAFISQGEIFEMGKAASPSEIGDAIAALADSARRDVSAARAIDRLDASLSKVGSDRARTARLPVARERLAETRHELEVTDELRREIATKAAQLDELQQKSTAMAQRETELRYLLHRCALDSIAQRLAAIDRAAGKLRDAEQRYAGLKKGPFIEPALRDQVVSLTGALARCRQSVADSVVARDDAAGAITTMARLEFDALRSSSAVMTDEERRTLEAIAYQQRPRRGLIAAIRRFFRNALAALGRLIARRSAPAAEPLTPAVTQTEALELLDNHRRYLALGPLAERLESAERRLEAEEDALAGTEARLIAVIRSSGIESATSDHALEAFEAAWKTAEDCRAAQSAHEAARREHELLLQGTSEDRLSALLQQHGDAAAALESQQPGLADRQARNDREGLERDLTKAQEEAHAAALLTGTLAEEVRVRLERTRPRAELEEEIAAYSGQVADLQKTRAALTMAKSTIEDAMIQVYRDFAPAVNSFLSDGIGLATDGRYTRVQVDPSTLRVSLLVPETGMVVTDPPVSHGTRTLIYVLMRIGLAQHMSAIGESVPLILDDPFVDLDSRRLPRVLDFLLGLSERMQILLFTKDEKVLEWFAQAQRGSECRTHEIDPLIPARM